MINKTFSLKDLLSFIEKYEGEYFDFGVSGGHRDKCGCLLFEFGKSVSPNSDFISCGWNRFSTLEKGKGGGIDYQIDVTVDKMIKFIRQECCKVVTKEALLSKFKVFFKEELNETV